MNSRIGHAALLLCPALAVTTAQVHVDPPAYTEPAPNDTVIRGNAVRRSVECKGQAVYVEGQQNQVELHGACSGVRVQGNGNVVTLDHTRNAAVEGMANTIYFTDPKTEVSDRGEKNRFVHRRGGVQPLGE